MAVIVVGRFLLSSKISNRVKRRRKPRIMAHSCRVPRTNICFYLRLLSTVPPILFFFLLLLLFTPLFVLLFRGTIHDFSSCPKAFLNVHHLPSRRGILYWQGDLDEIDTVKFYEPCSSPELPSPLL